MFKSDLEELGFCDETIRIFLDLDFKIRVTNRCAIIYTGEPLVEYRIHDEGIHNRPLGEVFRDLLYVYLKNFPLLAARTPEEIQEATAGVIERMFRLVAPIEHVCEERLHLIRRLDSECKEILKAAEDRLALIRGMEAESSELRTQNAELRRICEERMIRIRELERAVKPFFKRNG
jgi:hypothetical protein